jgi:hypothetical protein
MRSFRPAARIVLIFAASLLSGSVASAQSDAAVAAAALQTRYVNSQHQLARNPFGRPLHLDSKQSAADLSGDIYAVVDHPFAKVKAALDSADQWCDVLILHLNVKHCRSAGGPPLGNLAVFIGAKHPQPVASAQRVDFDFRVPANTPQYLRVELQADKGPLGTRNYRILFEAVPLDADRSFIHLSYAYGYGFLSRLAMQGYLGTIGRDKVGFSVVGHAPDGSPIYTRDVRGVIERNTMRYYLAIDAYLNTLDLPASGRLEQRLRAWFAATEQYPLQLRELSEREYLDMKRAEIHRQQMASAAPPRG